MKCIAPILVKNPNFKDTESHTPVRCGKCEGCTNHIITSWSFRLSSEAKRSIYVDFVTLTYDAKYVPLTNQNTHTLEKRDIQLFIKRLRKRNNGKIKYFAVGEYGTTSKRPHYHLICFGVSDAANYHLSWTRDGEPIGNVHIGKNVTDGAIPYTLKYISKKGQVPAFENDTRLPEFRLMSNRLGLCYLTPQIEKWHIEDFPNRQYVITSTGHKIAMPRFYKEILIKKYKYDRTLLIKSDEPYGIQPEDNRTLRSVIDNKKAMQDSWERKRHTKTERNTI